MNNNKLNRRFLSAVYRTLDNIDNNGKNYWRSFDEFVKKINEETVSSSEEIEKSCRIIDPNIRFFDKPFISERVKSPIRAFASNLLAKHKAYDRLLEFAYFPKKDNSLTKNGFYQAIDILAIKALPESWAYGNQTKNENSILCNYILHTFERLQNQDQDNNENSSWKKKICISSNQEYAIFNTGLVDKSFEPIYALFKRQHNQSPQNWKFSDFIKSDDYAHQELTAQFGADNLPEPADYYDDTSKLVYNTKSHISSFDWNHIINRCDRLPFEFLENNGPDNFNYEEQPKNANFFKNLASAIFADTQSLNRIKKRISEATNHSIKKVKWNFKTAVPIYYPEKRDISLLLPLSLTEDESISCALVLERVKPSGDYIAHTILTLQMAYSNARLITRPDSNWLITQNITASEDVNSFYID